MVLKETNAAKETLILRRKSLLESNMPNFKQAALLWLVTRTNINGWGNQFREQVLASGMAEIQVGTQSTNKPLKAA